MTEPYLSTLYDVAAEIDRARKKHPSNAHMLAALVEEVGELATALMEGTPEEIREEAMHCACVAVRIMEEGDADYTKTH